MTDLWYPLSGIPPHGRVHCWIHWHGREFRAARIVDERRNKPRILIWATLKDGIPEYLPPAGKEKDWGMDPDAFRPFDAKTWDWPLPAPLTAASGIMAAERVRFALVDEAEASDLAREMEDNRQLVSVSRGTYIPEPENEAWRIIYKIIYEPAGQVTPDLCRGGGRIMRALSYDKTIDVGHRRIKTNGAALARFGHAPIVADSEQTDQERQDALRNDWRPPFQADPRDIRDYDVVAPWINEYGWSRLEAQILQCRCFDPPPSFDEIGDNHYKSGEWARQIYKKAIAGICQAANGVVFKNAPAKLARVRERNRQARLRATA